ncbi:MAG: 3-dehydroquinate synthase [Clostridia bacterium]|nr:3-dehydroquinate synthase [Clostridia bacterium]MBQ1896175.1 3-dehydroquinate synthase [Clostridia bacterium]MBQ2092272.1 3-dehydroquinate synthase [Clostridia bacterium]MBQ3896998.1 3-dehydroquinate synthase [Clostridia bacterium]
MKDIHIGSGLLKNCGDVILAAHKPCRAALVTDYTVGALYVTTVADSLKAAGFEPLIFAFEAGEQSKNFETYEKIVNFLADGEITRSDIAVALGGGVVGDLTGFAAATYMRGIDYVQLPTTLLSMVDSSVGGKTGIDLDAGKNLCGAFRKPLCVIADTDTLDTLEDKYFGDGLAEVIKYAMLGNEKIMKLLTERIASENMRDSLKPVMDDLVTESVRTKLSFVEEDFFDNGRRKYLNFGHTIGHAIEHASRYAVRHGAAVATGMCAMARAGEKLGYTEAGTAAALEELVRACALPTDTIISPDDLENSALSDKKRRGSEIDLIFPEKPGQCRLITLPVSDLHNILCLGVK